MNAKGVNDLDPKLKEAYDRIMGTSLTPSKNAVPQQQTPLPNTPLMKTEPVVQKPPLQPAAETKNETQAPQLSQTPQLPLSVFRQDDQAATPQKKKINVMLVLVGLGGIIFLLAYALVWAKVFSLF